MEQQEREILSLEQKEIVANSTLLIPDNDGEAHLTIQIAKKLGMDVYVIDQSWGADIGKEFEGNPNFSNGFKKNVWIFEMPNSEIEEQLQYGGFTLEIIDHHEYKGDDRSSEKSSVEQFIEKMKLTEEQISTLGFDVKFVRGIGINDKSYIYGLRDAGYSEKEIKKIREFDVKSQMKERYEEMLAKNEEIYKNRIIGNGVVIIRALDTDICTITGDKIAFDYPGSIPKILDVRHDRDGKVSLLYFLGPIEATEKMAEVIPPTFMGSTKVSKKSNFMGWVKPTEEQLREIQNMLSIGEIK